MNGLTLRGWGRRHHHFSRQRKLPFLVVHDVDAIHTNAPVRTRQRLFRCWWTRPKNTRQRRRRWCDDSVFFIIYIAFTTRACPMFACGENKERAFAYTNRSIRARNTKTNTENNLISWNDGAYQRQRCSVAVAVSVGIIYFSAVDCHH